jgi:hypothetical protein
MRRVWTWLDKPLFPEDERDQSPRWFYLLIVLAVILIATMGESGDCLMCAGERVCRCMLAAKAHAKLMGVKFTDLE